MRVLPQEVVAPSGYTLLDQLGSGGFGEVWRAEAPGGVEKAVKIVFGHFEEELASRELKSLERVRGVRHPFLLSVERFEIVSNRLAIVTELADSSLDKRFKQCRREGLPGVPRGELIRYLSDAAEALDCLGEQHGLQHLDVKPENLLLVGEHVKVADFGLVKELGARTLNSMIGGMTPLYSPPEVYDDAPSMYSDQYSLAIVYQQMLTGVLPFSGRTPAQLAKQHTMMRPNVSALAESDQDAVLRALEKKPEERFPNSRQFIAALRDGKSKPTPAPVAPVAPNGPAPVPSGEDTKSILAISTTPAGQGKASAPAATPPPVQVSAAPPPKRVDRRFAEVATGVNEVRFPESLRSLPARTRATLVVGLGGLGGEMLAAFARLRSADKSDERRVEHLAIDTDRASQRELARELEGVLGRDDLLHLPLHRPKHYAGSSEKLLHWLSRRWLYNIPRSLATRGYRPLGRLALIDNAADARNAIESKLRALIEAAADESGVNVVLLASASGGTGGGVVIDVAQAVRSLGQELGIDVVVEGVIGVTVGREKSDADALAAGNTIAFLTELASTQQSGNRGAAPHDQAAAPFLRDGRPFDQVYTVSFTNRRERRQSLASVAAFLDLHTKTDLEPLFGCEGMEADAGAQGARRTEGLLRTFAAMRPATVMEERRRALADLVRVALAREWTQAISSSETACASPFTRALGDRRECRLAQAVARRVGPPPTVIVGEDEGSAPGRAYDPHVADARALGAFLQSCEELAMSSTTELGDCLTEELIESATQRCAARIVDDPAPVTAHDLAELLEAIVSDATEASSSNATEDLTPLLETNQLDCAHSRGRVFVGSAGTGGEAIKRSFSDALVIERDGSASVVAAVGAGVELRAIAARTAEGLEGVGDAAARLHSRQDVAWSDLREIVDEV